MPDVRLADIPVQECTFVGPVTDGITNRNTRKQQVIDRCVMLVVDKDEHRNDKGRTEYHRAKRDILELLQTRIEPLYPEEVRNELGGTNGNQHPIVAQLGRCPYHNAEDDGNEEGGVEVEHKEIRERLS